MKFTARMHDRGKRPGLLGEVTGEATWDGEGWVDTSGDWHSIVQIEGPPHVRGEQEWVDAMHRRGNGYFFVTVEVHED